MSDRKREQILGVVLKSLLKERALSMRKFAALIGIDTATISRIVNGKQTASVKHLEQFAHHLGVPLEQLLAAAGYDMGREMEVPPSDIYTSVDAIQEVLGSSYVFDRQYTTARVEQQLVNYEQYAQTEEGQQIIRDQFQKKLQQIGGVGPFIEQLKGMYDRFLSEHIPMEERAVIGSALLYFILSTDIIPDYLFPIGYLDDAIAVKLAMNKLLARDSTRDP